MAKGRFPKHKGTIRNVSIDTADIDNVLQQGAESNGHVVVKLKYKSCYRGNAYFEFVRPELIHRALAYLKENNALSFDISINLG